MRLKVYGIRLRAPRSWPIKPAENGDRQVRVVVAATSKGAAYGLIREAGVGPGMSLTYYRTEACETGNDVELAAALSRPGVVFHATSDLSRPEYLPVEVTS